MNVERMYILADLIEREQLPAHFNMDMFATGIGNVGETTKCGTSCCIGGMACLAFGEVGSGIGEGEATKLLDLNDAQIETLFYSNWGDTPSQAADRIRRVTREYERTHLRSPSEFQEFITSKGCGLCHNTGTITNTDLGEGRYCICPTGRALKSTANLVGV